MVDGGLQKIAIMLDGRGRIVEQSHRAAPRILGALRSISSRPSLRCQALRWLDRTRKLAILLTCAVRFVGFERSPEMSMWKEFREFALKANAFDLAIGVIIGLAFSKIVDSLVNDIVMPIIGAITGGLDFSNYFAPLSSSVTANTLPAAREQGAVLAYGNFLSVVVNFLIVAFVLFLVVSAVNRFKRKEPVPVATPPRIEVLLEEIRNLLARQSRSQ
jgi:large conductance mechanosensitive channel